MHTHCLQCLHHEIAGGRRGVFVKTHICSLQQLTSNGMSKKNANDKRNGQNIFSCYAVVRLR